MRITLEVKNKWGIVNRSIITPARVRNVEEMQSDGVFVAVQVRSPIYCATHYAHGQSWEDLKRRSSHGDPHRISIL